MDVRQRATPLVEALLLACVFALLLSPTPASAAPPRVVAAAASAIVVNFNVPVDAGSADYVQHAAQLAIDDRADLILVMNTPGGLLANMVQIVESIQTVQDAGLAVYTYVPPVAFAASAGSYIALATNATYMGSGSIIGPSTPHIVGGDPSEVQHVQNAMIAYISSLAQKNGYNVTAAANMAQNNVAYPASEAAAIGLVIDLFHRTLFLSVVAVIFIALGFLGAQVIGASIVGILMLIIAAALVILEVKAGHGLFAVTGIGLGVAGTYLLAYNVRYSPSPYGVEQYVILGGTGAALVVAFLYLTRIRRALMAQPKLIDPGRIVNMTGRATTDLVPGKDGVANVGAEDWTAQSDRFIPKGSLIRVTGYADGKVQVTVDSPGEPGPPKSNEPSATPPSSR